VAPEGFDAVAIDRGWEPDDELFVVDVLCEGCDVGDTPGADALACCCIADCARNAAKKLAKNGRCVGISAVPFIRR
jgi:hypothetical protein